MSAQSSIRIIGGKWRSRKVSFETKETLRPTPDRVRETLFNWLAPHIVDAVCIDLFAGSGALCFEALSRGAQQAIALDNDADNVKQMEKNKAVLQATEMIVLHKDALRWLEGQPIMADIIFVDPPYKLNLLGAAFNLLDKNQWVRSQCFIYFEIDKKLDEQMLPATWSIWRHGKAGNVYYYLTRKV